MPKLDPHRAMVLSSWAILSSCASGAVTAQAGTGCDARLSEGDVSAHHFVDINGAPLPQWEPVWGQLVAYFGSKVPDRITVRHSNNSASEFFPASNAIAVAPEGNPVATIAHESAHLSMFNLTNGVSNTNSFRFLDEGFAEIIAHRIAGDGDNYKTYALAVASQEKQKGNVSFAKVRDWSSYFGATGSNSSARNRRAYQVGSSFAYMIEDTRGSDALHAFFVDIGKTKNLDATIQNTFSSPPDAIEQEWLTYLANVHLDTTPPTIVSRSPPDMATGVAIDVKEITVTFATPMSPSTPCTGTPCGDTGVCYTNAYWKSPTVLAIKVDGALKRRYAYDLFLGSSKSGCHLQSYAAVDLPVTEWRFTAGE